MSTFPPMSLDESILRGFYLLANENAMIGSIAFFCAQYLGYAIVIVLIGYLFTHKKGLSEGFRDLFVVLTSAGIAWGASYFLKDIFMDPRPFVVFSDIISKVETPLFDSLPSGHATLFAAISASIFFYHRFMGLFFLTAALVIGWARIATGVHWPSDIIAGYIVGVSIAVIAHLSLTMFLRRFGFLTTRTKSI